MLSALVLNLRRSAPPTSHLVCSVEFAAGSNHRWPEAVVSLSDPENWFDRTPPEAFLLPMFFGRLTGAPDAYDRFYGRLVNAAMVELLDLLTASILESQEKAQRPTKGYGMTIDVLRKRLHEEERQAAEAVLMLIPERVGEITGPSYARITATLQTKKDKLGLALNMPPHEPESRKRRTRPEKSLALASAALISLVEEVSKTQDYEAVVVPTMEAVRAKVTDWQAKHDERGNPSK
jgi:hypothetical protein